MSLETQTAFARRLGVNKSTVHRHLKAGRIIAAGKLIDVDASLAKLHATTGTRPDVAARHAENRGAPIPLQPRAPQSPSAAVSAPPAADATTEHTDTGTKARYKAMAMHYENAQIKLEMALRRGIRHPLPAVRRESAALGGTLRSALERLIDQTAPRLAVITDTADRAALITAQALALRGLVRGEFPRALRRIRNHGAKP